MSQLNELVASLDYVKALSGKRILIKLGGAALQDMKLVQMICEDIARIRALGVQVLIVHGGGPAINEELTTHGIEWSFIGGQRVTTPEMMELVEMVLCGKINRRIVRTLNHSGVPAMGLSGTDASFLKCITVNSELGEVGQITEVNPGFIETILESKNPLVPVIAPIGFGQGGNAMNINADYAASAIAKALNIKKLIFLTDQDGILNTQKELISELDAGELEQLRDDGVVTGGMLTKVRAVLYALREGVNHVHIINARRPNALIEELFTDRGIGTVCRLRSRMKEVSHV